MQLFFVVLIFALLLQVSFAFTGVSSGNRLLHCARKTTTIQASLLDNVVQYKDIVSNKASFLLAEIDYEALEALGNISPDEAGSVAETGVTPIAGILTNIVSSPAILAVPIGAGLLVALGLGWFITSYGQGRDD